MSKLIMAEIQTQSKSLRELREELQALVDESMFKEFLKVYVSRNSGFIALLAHYVDTTVHTPVWTTKAKSMSHAMQLFWSHRNAT